MSNRVAERAVGANDWLCSRVHTWARLDVGHWTVDTFFFAGSEAPRFEFSRLEWVLSLSLNSALRFHYYFSPQHLSLRTGFLIRALSQKSWPEILECEFGPIYHF